MNWFNGSIIDAIQTAKNNKSLFIVFVNGDDAVSRELLKTWQDERVGQLSSANNCVALKLDATSEPAVQFSQIYPVMIFPTVYFIGDNGQPLEVCVGQMDADQLLDRFNNALKMHTTALSGQHPSQPLHSPQSQPPSDVVSEASSSVVQAEAAGQEDDDDNLTVEEKAEKAKQIIIERQREKMRQKEDEEKQKEIERRKLGQEALKFKEWKEDMAKKETENFYKKEKEEARIAREKVRQDLERDRQERAKRYYDQKADKEIEIEKIKVAKLENQMEKQAKENAMKRETARLQFRLPDGSSVTQSFPSSELLSSARSFILQRLHGVYRSVSLSTTFPKRKFTEEDMSRTLLELDLAPSAILLVLPEQTPSSFSYSSSDGENSGFLWLLLAPLLALWHFICNFLFAQPPQQQLPSAASEQTDSSSTQQQSPPPPSPSEEQQHYGARRKDPQTLAGNKALGLRKRQDGNVHRLTADDEDDESATWNGNSTQQM